MFGKSSSEETSKQLISIIEKLEKVEESNLLVTEVVNSFVASYRDVVSEGLKKVCGVLREQNSRSNELIEVLDKHLEVARLRAGLETTDRGAYESMLRGLKHLSGNCGTHYGVKKQYQGTSRKVDSLIKELEHLEQQAYLDALISNLLKQTSVVRKDKVKPSNTE